MSNAQLDTHVSCLHTIKGLFEMLIENGDCIS